MTRTFRYVVYARIADYERLGWMIAFDLGLPHSQWSVMMEWRCDCRCVEPLAARRVVR